MKFQYDENGDTSRFFVIGLVLAYVVPASYFHIRYFVSDRGIKAASEADSIALKHNKWQPHLKHNNAFKKRHAAWLAAIAFLFVLLASPPPPRAVDPAQAVATPFDILGVSKSATVRDISKAYLKLAKKEHPDVSKRPKDEANKFWMEVNEAKEILTDPVKRGNWEQFGHPDGPQPMVMGLALPAWLVERENQYFVVLFYFLLVGLAIPYAIAKFYRTNQKFSGSGEVMMQTQWGLYRSELEGDVQIQELLDVLSASLEYKEQIPHRTTDAADTDKILDGMCEKFGPGLREAKNMKYNLTSPASVKAKVLLCAHLHGIKVPERLADDQRKVLELAPKLIDGIMSMAYLKSQQVFQISVVVLRAMDLLVTIVQARIAHTMPPIYQLPHVAMGEGDETFKQKKLMMPQQLYELDDAVRRKLCSYMSDAQYKEMMTVMENLPIVTIKSNFETSGEKHIVPGSIITVKVNLVRSSMAKMKQMKEDGTWANLIANNKREDEAEEDTNGGALTDEQIDELFRKAKLQKQQKRLKLLNTTESCIAYAPEFPTIRREKWWLMVMLEPRRGNPPPILAAPKVITNLLNEKEEEITFQAPPQSGTFNLIVQVKSMDYAGFDSRRIVKLDIATQDTASNNNSREDSDGDDFE